MNQLFRFGLILGVICLIATLVLAVTYEVTRPKIEGELKLEEENALKEILPEADSFRKKTLEEMDYFEAFKGSVLIGYCIRCTGSGYSGYIRIIAGIDTSGVIEGIRILEHYETPGLGARINEVKPGEKEPHFLRQFAGKFGRTITIKDIDAITGATISSKAVTDAVRETVGKFLERLKR